MPEIPKSAPSNVTLLGRLPRDAMPDLYRNARFLVVPSVWFEGFPMAVLEAMSYGLPVIASRIGGLPEIVDDGVSGLLFAPGDATDLAGKMKLLWDNAQLRAEMGDAARAKVVGQYDRKSYFERLTSIYRTAIASSS